MMRKVNKEGFSLVELLAVIVVLGIIASIAFVTITGRIQKAKVDVCEVNRLHLEESYHDYLFVEEIEHSELEFINYLNNHNVNICPEGGSIIYKDGDVLCNLHSDIELNPTTDDPVPYL